MKNKSILLLIFLLLLTTGCTISINKDISSNNEEEEEKEEEEENESLASIGTSSSLSNPLSIGEYGVASKYNAYLNEYKDVDVAITKVYDNPDSVIDEYNSLNTDTIELESGFKFVVLDYEVIFYDFDTESFGTDVTVDVEVLDTDGNSFVIGETKQFISVKTLSTTTGVINGESGTVKIAFAIPTSADNYLVKLGTKDYTIAYYKI